MKWKQSYHDNLINLIMVGAINSYVNCFENIINRSMKAIQWRVDYAEKGTKGCTMTRRLLKHNGTKGYTMTCRLLCYTEKGTKGYTINYA